MTVAEINTPAEVQNLRLLQCDAVPITGKADCDLLRVLTTGMVKGTESAYVEFHRLYFDRLFRYLLVVHHGSEDHAKEALQLTLLRVVRYIKVFQDADGFWRWLTMLARSCSEDERRKRFRYFSFLTRVAKAVPEGEIQNGDNLQRIADQQLELLPPDEKELITRKYFAEETVKGIAGDLGMTEKAIESRLTRARSKLKLSILTALKNE